MAFSKYLNTAILEKFPLVRKIEITRIMVKKYSFHEAGYFLGGWHLGGYPEIRINSHDTQEEGNPRILNRREKPYKSMKHR